MSITKEDLENMSIEQLEAVIKFRAKRHWHKGVIQATKIMVRKMNEEAAEPIKERN